MAASTCEAVTLPEEQAEPDETAMPLRSKAIMAVSALTPGTANSVVLGSRGASAPKITTSGRCLFQAGFEPVAQSRHARSVRLRCGERATAAAPKPAMAATFSVPARCPRSCPPPLISGAAMWMSPRRTSAPAPCGPPILCADSVSRSAPRSSMRQAMRPGACTASTCRRPLAAWTNSADLRDRLDHAGFVVGEHDRNKRVLGSSKRASESMTIEQTGLGHRQRFHRLGRETTAARAPKGVRWPRQKACRANALRPRSQSPASAPACWLRWRRW